MDVDMEKLQLHAEQLLVSAFIKLLCSAANRITITA